MTMLKIGFLAAAVAIFFWLLVFGPFYGDVAVQLVVLVGVTGWSMLRFALRETLALLRFCLPFTLFLLFFGLVFHFTQLLGRTDWLQDSLIKCLIFPSSLLFLKIVLSHVTYLDILGLPLSMKKRLEIVTVKTAFQKGGGILGRFSWFLTTYPMLKDQGRFKSQWIKYACLIIALYLYLYEEIETSQRLLKNRYQHLNGENR